MRLFNYLPIDKWRVQTVNYCILIYSTFELYQLFKNIFLRFEFVKYVIRLLK